MGKEIPRSWRMIGESKFSCPLGNERAAVGRVRGREGEGRGWGPVAGPRNGNEQSDEVN